jgi:hypothetical protein
MSSFFDEKPKKCYRNAVEFSLYQFPFSFIPLKVLSLHAFLYGKYQEESYENVLSFNN